MTKADRLYAALQQARRDLYYSGSSTYSRETEVLRSRIAKLEADLAAANAETTN